MISLTTLDLSFNNFVGRIPSGGQFLAFNASSFVGNLNLCPPRHVTCPSLVNHAKGLGHSHATSFTASKLIITTITIITTLLLMVVTLYRMRKKRLEKSRAWKLTAFQKLRFKADDVLACLQEENIIGKGGVGIVYLHHDCSPLIIHRDVKSNNILLDEDYEAHVADFGLTKFLHDPGASECMSVT